MNRQVNRVGQFWDNNNAVSSDSRTLPTGKIGLIEAFYVMANQELIVNAPNGKTLSAGGVSSAAGGNVRCDTQGSSLVCFGVQSGDWIGFCSGAWNLDQQVIVGNGNPRYFTTIDTSAIQSGNPIFENLPPEWRIKSISAFNPLGNTFSTAQIEMWTGANRSGTQLLNATLLSTVSSTVNSVTALTAFVPLINLAGQDIYLYAVAQELSSKLLTLIIEVEQFLFN